MTPVENLLAGYLVGTILVAIFFGATTLQAWSYFIRFRDDELWIKAIVLFLMGIQPFNLGCLLSMFWYIATFKMGVLVRNPWFGNSFQYSTIVSAVFVHFFFIGRIRKMTKWPWLASIITVTALCTFGFGLSIAIVAQRIKAPAPLIHTNHDSRIIGWCTSQAMTDVLIAVSMIVYLRSMRTGFPWTDKALRLLTMYAVNSGLVTSLLALGALFSYTLYTHAIHCFYLSVSLSLGGVYTGTLLANLHARTSVRSRLGHSTGSDAFHSIRLSQLPKRVKRNLFAGLNESRPDSNNKYSAGTSSDRDTLDRRAESQP